MPTTKMLNELKRLLLETSEVGDVHLSKIEADLIQTDILLDEAIAKLTDGFMSLHNTLQEQQQEFDLLLSGKKAATPENLAHLRGLREKINQYIHVIVTALQFQDMTSQLLERVVRRIIGLREVLKLMHGCGEQIKPQEQMAMADIEVLLDKTSMLMGAKMKDLETVLWRAVRQTRMESGDIDLF
jgi:hypothetical protein